MTVDGISYHPIDGETSHLGTLDHAPGELRFGGKGEALGNMSGAPTRQISTPLLGQVQLTVDESMTQCGDVGEKDSHLAVFHAPRVPAVLRPNASRVLASFGKATFV